ncbi:MAG: thymidylate synthase [Acidimicrobiales bacterium]|jgi:thymidylate synthase
MSVDPPNIDTATIGEAWIAVARLITEDGVASTYDGLAIREVLMTTIIVRSPDTADDIIERFADPERLAWMHANFDDFREVPELGNADSYATRLHNYAGTGLDQLRWVSERLRHDPRSRSATITTLQPLSDTSYIPCVSLLDFYLDDDALELVVYAHSIDFGSKGYANLLEIAAIQHQVARELVRGVGSLTVVVKSAHVYDSDAEYVSSVLANFVD